MKKLITILVIWIAAFNVGNGQAFVQLHNSSGYEFSPIELDSLVARSQKIIDVLPTAIQNDFKVFDYGYYVFSDLMNGGRAAEWDKAKTVASAASSYYLLFGREYDRSTGDLITWVDIQLPINSTYLCVDREKIEMLNNYLAFKINNIQQFDTIDKILYGITSAKKEFDHIFNCCENRTSCGNSITIDEAVTNLTGQSIFYGEDRYVELQNVSNLQLDPYYTPSSTINYSSNKLSGYKLDFNWVDSNDESQIEVVDLNADFEAINNQTQSSSFSILHFDLDSDLFYLDRSVDDWLKAPYKRTSSHETDEYYEDIIILTEGAEMKVLFRFGAGVEVKESSYRNSSDNNRMFAPLIAKVLKRLAMAGGSILLNLYMESKVTNFMSTFTSDICTFSEAWDSVLEQKNIWSYIIWGLEGAFADFLGKTKLITASAAITSAIIQYILNPPPPGFTVDGLVKTVIISAVFAVVTIIAARYLGKILEGIGGVLITKYGFTVNMRSGFFYDLKKPEFLVHLIQKLRLGCGEMLLAVKAWKGLSNTGVKTDISWLTRASKWIDQGGDFVETGGKKWFKKNGDNIFEIRNDKILPNKKSNYHQGADGTPIGESANGYQVVKIGDDIKVKRIPDETPYVNTPYQTKLTEHPNAHVLKRHGHDVTDDALIKRANEGIAPDGSTINPNPPYTKPPYSSKFDSPDALKNGYDNTMPGTNAFVNTPVINSKKVVYHTLPSGSYGKGVPRNGSVLETLTKVRAVYEDMGNGNWQLLTMFPDF